MVTSKEKLPHHDTMFILFIYITGTKGIEEELFLSWNFILFYADDTVILAESANDL